MKKKYTKKLHKFNGKVGGMSKKARDDWFKEHILPNLKPGEGWLVVQCGQSLLLATEDHESGFWSVYDTLILRDYHTFMDPVEVEKYEEAEKLKAEPKKA